MENVIKIYDKVNNLSFSKDENSIQVLFTEGDFCGKIFLFPKFIEDKKLAYYDFWEYSTKQDKLIQLRVNKNIIEYTESDSNQSKYIKKQTINLNSGNVYTKETIKGRNKEVSLENNKNSRVLTFPVKESILNDLTNKLKKNGKKNN